MSIAGALRTLAPAILCALIWWTHLVLPANIAGASRDPSWTAALGYATSHGWQAGLDYVFTFGPLGYFSTETYVPELFWIKLVAWEGAFKLLLAWVLARVALGIPGILNRSLFILLLLIQPPDPDAYAFFAMVGIAAWVLERDDGRLRTALGGLALLAVFPLVKFSYSAPAVACALAIVASHGWTLSWKAGAGLAFAFLAATAAAWTIAGQSLTNLPVYVRRSIEVASGYSEGMSRSAPSGTVAAALALALPLVFLAVLHACASPRSPSRPISRWAWTCAFVPVLWVAYKCGFVRALDHTPTFFGFTMLAAFLPRSGGLTLPWKRVAALARLVCATLSLVGLSAASERGAGELVHLLGGAGSRAAGNARALLDPAAFRADCEKRLEIARRWSALPRTCAAVGDGTIDMVSSRQGLLFLHDLNWRSRPVFQSYATLTPELMELNAAFFRSERASDFILLRMETIDGRLLTMDDALALPVLARDYVPVLIEKGYLLLRRAPRPEPLESPRVVIEKEIAFGETVDLRGLEGGCHLLRLDIRYTLWGRIWTFLDRAPPLFLQIESDDGEALEVRIIPGMMQAGVIIDPLIRNQVEWRNWTMGETPPRPVALRLTAPASPSWYRGAIGVTVLRADAIVPRPHPELKAPPESLLFETPPLETHAAAPAICGFVGEVGQEEAVVLPAPSEMRYEVGSGAHVLKIGFGFATQAWRTGGTDGATFSVVARRPGREDVVLFRRFLDPARITKHREAQAAEVRFQLDTTASLLLCTDPGPQGDATGDFTAWTAVSLE